jgi:hypothetical protein
MYAVPRACRCAYAYLFCIDVFPTIHTAGDLRIQCCLPLLYFRPVEKLALCILLMVKISLKDPIRMPKYCGHIVVIVPVIC